MSWLIVAAYTSIGIAVIAFNLMLFDLSVRGHFHRWPLYAFVVVLGCESILCFFLGSDEWTEQYLEGAASVQTASVHVRFAIELCAIGALSLLASILFLLRQWGWLWWTVIGMQVAIFVLAEIEAQLVDPNSPGWSAFRNIPLVTVFLLFAIRLGEAMQKRPIERNATP
jgi:signal transduction histidine kinase